MFEEYYQAIFRVKSFPRETFKSRFVVKLSNTFFSGEKKQLDKKIRQRMNINRFFDELEDRKKSSRDDLEKDKNSKKNLDDSMLLE